MRLSLLGVAVFVHLLPNVAVSSATAFGCNDRLISDEWRQMVLDYHNEQRKKVAQGKQKSNDGNMPAGNHIFELNWDCNLEQNAFLRNCDNNINFATGYSEVSATIKLTGKPCDIEKETKTTLNKLWNEALKADLSQNPIYDNTTIMNFGRMVYWAADGFACTYNKACSDKLRCLYTADPKNGKPLYKVGSTCKSAPGYCLPGYTCVDYLCKKNTEYIPTQATLPLYCQPGTDGLTFEQQNAAANMMNYYRRLLGTGWAEDKNGYAPIARMLYPLVYLCKTIGKASKEIADKCVMPPYTATHGHILSYHIIKKLNVDPKAALEEAIKTWAGQLKKVDPQTIGGAVFYQDEVEEKASDWAKMVTSKNSAVGCSVKECADQGFTLVICQYNGLFTSRDTLYAVGKPCSGCADPNVNRKCDTALGGGLCIKP